MMIRNCVRMIFFKLQQAIFALRVPVFTFFLLISATAFGNVVYPTQESVGEPVFILNKGQWPKGVLSKAHLNIGDLWITQSGFVWNLFDSSAFEKLHDRTTQTLKIPTQAVFMDFIKPTGVAHVTGSGTASSEYYNYHNARGSFTELHKYSSVIISHVWPGVDLEVKSFQNTIKYNWIVHSTMNPNIIRWNYRGENTLELSASKQYCRIKTNIVDWTEEIPAVYYNGLKGGIDEGRSENSILRANYVQFDDGSFQFNIKNLDLKNNRDLVIDPKLVFSTYTGSRADNFGCTGTYDIYGNGYAGGTVFDVGLPVTPGAAQTTFGDGVSEDLGYGGSRDAAILKFNATGNQLLFCSYLGGSNNEQPHSMVTDSLVNLYVMGSTRSTDFPMGANGQYDNSHNGGYDFFITKFNSTGTKIIASTFFGGSGMDAVGADRSATGVSVDDFPLIYNYADEFRGEIITDQKNIYVSGITYSLNFPRTGNGAYGGKSDAVVFCLNNSLTILKWSQQFGGVGYDALYGVALGKSNDVYVSGGSSSNNLKTVIGSKWINDYQGGIADAILMRLDKYTGDVLQGRYHGTSLYEQAHFVQTGLTGKPYIYGQTEANMPNVNARFYQPGGGQYISCYSIDLSSVDMQTTFGYNASNIIYPNISPSAFLVDRCERIFVSGWGGSTNSALYDVNTGTPKQHRNKGRTIGLLTTADAAQKNTDGSDFYIAVFSKNFYSLAYATFFGGVSTPGKTAEEHVDGGTSRFDAKGIIYQSVCAGCRRNGLFPTTPTAYSKTMNSNNCNNALFKIDFENLNLKPRLKDTFVQVIATQPINFQIKGVDPDPFDTMYLRATWIKKGGMKGADTAKFTLIPGIGSATLKLDWKTLCSSFSKDTLELLVTVMDRGCPKSDTTYARIKILVTEPPKVIPPDAICVSFDRQTSKMSISWNNIATPGSFFKYFLLRRTNPDGSMKILDTIRSGSADVYVDGNVVNPRQNNYCYELIGVNICDVQVFAKNIFCTVIELNTPIAGVPLYTTTIVNDRYAEIRWGRSQEPDFKEYELYRIPRGGKFGNVPLAITTDTFYRDSSFNVDDRSYCYQIMVTDQCGHVSSGSNEGCNVVLGGTSKEAPDYYFDLNWMDYQGWADGVRDWALERKDDDHAFIVMAPSLMVQSYHDDKLDYDYGGYLYRVTAHRNQLMAAEQSYSESNWIYLIQPPEVWVPSGITRNKDGLNDVWGTFPLFVKDYEMKVYNRYGQKIWESTYKKNQWDCQYQSSEIPDGVYAWYLVFTGWDKKTYEKVGTVTVIH